MPDTAIAVLGQVQVDHFILIGVCFLVLRLLVILFAIKEHDDIGVLLDRAGFTQVGPPKGGNIFLRKRYLRSPFLV